MYRRLLIIFPTICFAGLLLVYMCDDFNQSHRSKGTVQLRVPALLSLTSARDIVDRSAHTYPRVLKSDPRMQDTVKKMTYSQRKQKRHRVADTCIIGERKGGTGRSSPRQSVDTWAYIN